MKYQVILERDGIYRSVDALDGRFRLPKAQPGDQVFVVDADSSTEAVQKAGKLWKLET